MTRYKDVRFCEYVWADDKAWTKDGEELIECMLEDTQEPTIIKRKYLSEAPVNFGCSY